MGIVYDIDFLYNNHWTQVLISVPPGPNLVTIVQDVRVASLLAAAYADRAQVHVGLRPQPAGPPEIVMADVYPNQAPMNPPGNEWAINRVQFDLLTGRTQADFFNPATGPLHGWDDTNHALQVLNAAIAAREFVEYLTIDPAGRITRVKVNH